MGDRLIPTLVVVALIVLAMAGMAWGWRGRSRSQRHLPAVAPLPADPGVPEVTADALYVATTLRDRPLERIVASGLGMRSPVTVQVFDAGTSLALAGRDAAFLPAERIEGAGRASFTVDKGVEPNGLVVIAWSLGDTAVDTYLRPADPRDAPAIIDAVNRTARGSVASTADPTDRSSE
ncbi:MAG: hypothetical protein JWP66_1625 [Naasia sp.]|nr:hypothetical protein [Naasia sp.]